MAVWQFGGVVVWLGGALVQRSLALRRLLQAHVPFSRGSSAFAHTQVEHAYALYAAVLVLTVALTCAVAREVRNTKIK